MVHGWMMIWGWEFIWLIGLVGAAAVAEIVMAQLANGKPIAVRLRRRQIY